MSERRIARRLGCVPSARLSSSAALGMLLFARGNDDELITAELPITTLFGICLPTPITAEPPITA